MSTISTDDVSPWHSGELALQEKAGVVAKMRDVGRRVIRDYMPEQHRTFFRQLPFIVLGTVADGGDVWATFAAGRPGFMHAPTDKVLRIGIAADPHDPASSGLYEGAAIGMLGIELHTRRRNRLNGTVRDMNAQRFDVGVVQSFGNCPQYIQARDFEFIRDPAVFSNIEPTEFDGLPGRARVIIEAADTFFVASYAGDGDRRQVDVSHRGGKAGFVRIGDDGRLTIPDFAGNLFFATLGNFVVNPRAGLVFADFETGDLLQLTGDARVDLDSAEIAAFQGAGRLWHFTPRRIVYRAGALPLRWKFQANGWSPNSLMTGLLQERGVTRMGRC